MNEVGFLSTPRADLHDPHDMTYVATVDRDSLLLALLESAYAGGSLEHPVKFTVHIERYLKGVVSERFAHSGRATIQADTLRGVEGDLMRRSVTGFIAELSPETAEGTALKVGDTIIGVMNIGHASWLRFQKG